MSSGTKPVVHWTGSCRETKIWCLKFAVFALPAYITLAKDSGALGVFLEQILAEIKFRQLRSCQCEF